VTDTVLVRAPVGAVYRTLTDLDGWPAWYAGCRSVRRPAATGGHDAHDLVLPAGRRRWRCRVEVSGWRHDAGVRWEVRSPVTATTEWWLEACREGTRVHHVLHGAVDGDARGGGHGGTESARRVRRLRRHRRAAVDAMQALKDHLERAVTIASGRTP
jgi:hypothetical protein